MDILTYTPEHEDFRQRLLENRDFALTDMNMSLSESEKGMFDAVSEQQLKGMIETFRPDNQGRRDFMKMVAASTAAVAVGSVTASCGEEADVDDYAIDAGIGPDANYDSGWHPGADADADNDADTDADADADGDADSDADSDADADSGTDAGMDASKDAETDV